MKNYLTMFDTNEGYIGLALTAYSTAAIADVKDSFFTTWIIVAIASAGVALLIIISLIGVCLCK